MVVKGIVEVRGADALIRKFEGLTGGAKLALAVQRGLDRSSIAIANDAKERAPYRTGKGRRSIYTQRLATGIGARVVVPPIVTITNKGPDLVPYMLYQHEGTGVYGPTGAPIVPISSPFLVFRVPGLAVSRSGKLRRTKGPLVFAKSVRGVPPNPFLTDAYESLKHTAKLYVAEEVNAALHGAAL